MLFLTSKKLETAKFRCKMQILERLRKLNIQYIQAFYLNSKFQLKNQNLFIGLKLSWMIPAVLNQKCKVILSNRFFKWPTTETINYQNDFKNLPKQKTTIR